MRSAPLRILTALAAVTLVGADAPDMARMALPSPAPRFARPDGVVLFADDFSDQDFEGWAPDREGVWAVRRGMLRADLPDAKQERSFLYVVGGEWQDVAVDLDVCAMRGVDKGVVVRIVGDVGIAVDLRGPGYQDVLLHRREWPLGKARVVNANGVWHHLRIEAAGPRYRVFVNGRLAIEREDRKRVLPGRIALAAYTGGVGQCTVYYDNVVVTALGGGGAVGAAADP
jgi:hypothetical protein